MSARSRWLVRVGALLLGAGACAGWTRTEAVYGWFFWLWVAAMAIYVGGAPSARGAGTRPAALTRFGLGAVLMLAAAVRLPGLAWLPGNISIDEVLPGAEALHIMHGAGPNPMASVGWFTMPRFSFAVQAAVFTLAGEGSLWALRLSSALMGLAGLVATFALGRRLVGDRAALVGTFLMAVSVWHVHNSRTGFPFWQSSCGTALAVYLLARGRQDGNPAAVALAGVVTGLVLQWYFPVRILLLVCPLFLVSDWYERGGRRREVLADTVWFALGAVLALAPLLTCASWADLVVHSRAVMQVPAEGGWTAAVVADHFGEALRMLTRWSYLAVLNRSPSGLLESSTRAALAIGLAVSLLQGRPLLLFLVAWFALTFVGGVVLTDTPRASYRLAAAMPAIFLLAGVGVERILSVAPADSRWYGRSIRRLLIAAAAFGVAAHNGYLFFVEYANGDGRETVHAAALRELAARCDGRKLVLGMGIEHGTELALFCPHAVNVESSGILQAIDHDRAATVIMFPDAVPSLAELRACVPESGIRLLLSGEGGRPLLIAVDLPFPRADTGAACAVMPRASWP